MREHDGVVGASNVWMPGSSAHLQHTEHKVGLVKETELKLTTCLDVLLHVREKVEAQNPTHLVSCQVLSGPALSPSPGALKSLSYMKGILFCHHKSF